MGTTVTCSRALNQMWFEGTSVTCSRALNQMWFEGTSVTCCRALNQMWFENSSFQSKEKAGVRIIPKIADFLDRKIIFCPQLKKHFKFH